MDGPKFDALTRRLGVGTTRRRMIGSMFGLGATLAMGADTRAARTCRAYGVGCTRGAQCCAGFRCETSRAVPRSQRNRCICPAGQGWCGGGCVSLLTEENCGACGNACTGDDSTCVSGTCICADETKAFCDGVCTDVDTSFEHCGACGNSCDADQYFSCKEGVCLDKCFIDSPNFGDVCMVLVDGGTARPLGYYGVTYYPRCTSDEDCPVNLANNRCVVGENAYYGAWYWSTYADGVLGSCAHWT